MCCVCPTSVSVCATAVTEDMEMGEQGSLWRGEGLYLSLLTSLGLPALAPCSCCLWLLDALYAIHVLKSLICKLYPDKLA